MNDKEKEMFLKCCYNENTNKYEIPCKCGQVFNLNIKMVWIINMHQLRCKKCKEIIIPNNAR